MKKNNPIQLSIPSPCSQDWNEMMPDAKGRFCAHCQKSVIDFTTWSDVDLFAFFSKNNQSVCGRFQTYQLDRAIQLPVQKPTRLYRVAIALGLSLMFSQLPATHARPKPPLMEQNVLMQDETPENNRIENDSVVIKGTVIGYRRPPTDPTLIYARLNEQYLNYTYAETSGRFELIIHRKLLPSDTISIYAFSAGYYADTLKWSVSNNQEIVINLQIDVPYNTIIQGKLNSGPLNIGKGRKPVIEPPASVPELTPDQIKRLINNSAH